MAERKGAMNMKELKSWSIIGAVFSAGAGVLLHFVYDFFGGSVWACFSGVNESTWEHLKLLFWPVAVFMLLEYAAYGREIKGFAAARLVGIIAGMVSIVILFYTYSGILGYNISIVNILLFFIGDAAAYIVPLLLLGDSDGMNGSDLKMTYGDIAASAGFILLAVLFIMFTEEPPQLGLFQDPVTGRYGIFN